MENMELYNALRSVPQEAKKEIKGGRLRGMTDINPVWRIKALTEKFGPCGIGWWYTIEKQWTEMAENGESSAFCNINLFYEVDGKTSHPIPGTGGSMFISKEKNGIYVDDDAFKKALTDAISVSAKAIGVGADVYFEKDITKYNRNSASSVELEKYVKATKNALKKLFNNDSTAAKSYWDEHIAQDENDLSKMQYHYKAAASKLKLMEEKRDDAQV